LRGAERFRAALAGDALAFAPILWEQLPELVRQPRPDWWQDPTTGQRLIADAAALALADAMFVFAAAEALEAAVDEGTRGDQALQKLAQGAPTAHAVRLLASLHAVSEQAVIAAVPAPAAVQREVGGEEIEAAEDVFSDLAIAYLEAGADALAVTGGEVDEVSEGVRRAARMARLFERPALGLCVADARVSGWVHDGGMLGVVSEAGRWPALDRGVVTTPGDVSGRWSADLLHTVGSARR
jgi:hypothetical protein